MERNYKRVKLACYTTNICMAAIGSLPPLLFLTFRDLYGTPFSLLGTLVFVSFGTQLVIDLIFSFFSHKFNIPLTVKLTPLLAVVGLTLYALWPLLFPSSAYIGLVIGTLIFSASCGLSEVLISPAVAAIPSDNPEREMSKLHSIFAWGCVAVIPVSTAYLALFGGHHWHYLALFFVLIPLTAFVLFTGATMPAMETPKQLSNTFQLMKNKQLWVCVFLIFLGGSSECTMSQWCSGYLENALAIPKIWGDIFGAALFAVALGIGRSLYAKIGKNITRALFWGAVGATACYLIAAVVDFPIIGLFACAFTGFCASMMWPGSLIVAANRFPVGGVLIYAMMAAGGDLGASVGPQLVGIVTDTVAAVPAMNDLAVSMGLAPAQLGMKLGMLVGMLFPLCAIFLIAHIRHAHNKT